MVLFIKKLLDIYLQLSGFDVVIYFGNHDKDLLKIKHTSHSC